jgi:hypothetical protein
MSYSKFASMTANLVARNSEAAPALALVSTTPAVSWAHGPDGREMPERRCALPHSLIEEGYRRWRSTDRNDFAPANAAFEGRSSHRPRAHKLVVAMTDAEYEALALIAAKSGLTRHQVIRNALNGYFKWLADEYASTCSCISMLCSNAGSATAASRNRRH